MAPEHVERWSERQQEQDLMLDTLGRLREVLAHSSPRHALTDDLDMGRALGSPLASALPVRNSRCWQASLSVVEGEEFRLCGRDLRESERPVPA